MFCHHHDVFGAWAAERKEGTVFTLDPTCPPLSRSVGISCSDSLFLFGFVPWLTLSAGLSDALFAVLSQFLEFFCEFFFSPELLISTGPFLPAAELSVASVLPFRPTKPGVLDAGSEVREPDTYARFLPGF